MRFILTVLHELFGLFVDDGNLAVQVLALIGLVAATIRFGGLDPLIGALLLLCGCIAILALSLRRVLRG